MLLYVYIYDCKYVHLVFHRAENRAFLDGQCFSEEIEDGTFIIHKKAAMTSTPINLSLASCSTLSVDPATAMKLTAMEDELAELRKQIAQLVMSQEVVNKSVKGDLQMLVFQALKFRFFKPLFQWNSEFLKVLFQCF